VTFPGINVTISKAILEQFDELSARAFSPLTRPTGENYSNGPSKDQLELGMSFQDIDPVINRIDPWKTQNPTCEKKIEDVLVGLNESGGSARCDQVRWMRDLDLSLELSAALYHAPT
jgi:hypothetical protein